MARTTIIARADKRDAEGTLPLFLRLSHQNKVSYLTLSLRVKETDWNPSRCEIRKSHAEHRNLNSYLAETRQMAESAVSHLLASGQQVTTTAVKDILRQWMHGTTTTAPVEVPCFLAYCDSVVHEFVRRGQIGTSKAYRTVVGKLRAYVQQRSGLAVLPYDEITVSFLRGFQTYLIETRGNRTNTVHKALSTVRSILFQAMRDGHFPQEKNPFFHLKMRKERVRKEKLSIEDIAAIEKLPLEKDSLLWEVRSWFLFAFYAGGIRFSDVAMLEWKHLKSQRLEDGSEVVRLVYQMKKTRESSGTLLVPQALAILEHYRQRAQKRSAAEQLLFGERVFPVLDGYDLSTPAKVLSAVSSRNALSNRYLKTMQERAGVETHLSFHLARHSLADHLRKKGWSVYDISKVLAHSSIAVTEQYLKGFDQEDLDEKMRQVF
jgi:site-specific recombinase XerD